MTYKILGKKINCNNMENFDRLNILDNTLKICPYDYPPDWIPHPNLIIYLMFKKD